MKEPAQPTKSSNVGIIDQQSTKIHMILLLLVNSVNAKALKNLNFEWQDAAKSRLNKMNELDEFRLWAYESKLKSRWNGPFTVIRVFSYGSLELERDGETPFELKGQRVWHYMGIIPPKGASSSNQAAKKDNNKAPSTSFESTELSNSSGGEYATKGKEFSRFVEQIEKNGFERMARVPDRFRPGQRRSQPNGQASEAGIRYVCQDVQEPTETIETTESYGQTETPQTLAIKGICSSLPPV
ncbi:hypothetical protein FXO38_27491 [Capsicum annuum]|nr:hypothetical protein FXO38_27491 [Capsicum annuum]KAF3667261.1 hypothetical protein FXO37_10101 [Capsicum annuum]